MADKLVGEIVFTGELRRLSRARHIEVAALLGATPAGLVRSTTMLVICGASLEMIGNMKARPHLVRGGE